jgi:hypothetical protein
VFPTTVTTCARPTCWVASAERKHGAVPASESALTSNVARDKRLLRLVDTLIPSDDGPGATLANLDCYVESHWAECGAERLKARLSALARLEAEARVRTGRSFAELNNEEAACVVGELERGETRAAWPEDFPAEQFIAEVIQLAHEGFYGSWAGDAREPAGWVLLGYQPGVT